MNIRIFVTKITNTRIYSFTKTSIFVFEYLLFGQYYSNIFEYSLITGLKALFLQKIDPNLTFLLEPTFFVTTNFFPTLHFFIRPIIFLGPDIFSFLKFVLTKIYFYQKFFFTQIFFNIHYFYLTQNCFKPIFFLFLRAYSKSYPIWTL